MALIKKFEKVELSRNRVHGPASGTYSVFSEGEQTYLQLDTYGSVHRQIKGKKSQSIQLDRESAQKLAALLHDTFRF